MFGHCNGSSGRTRPGMAKFHHFLCTNYHTLGAGALLSSSKTHDSLPLTDTHTHTQNNAQRGAVGKWLTLQLSPAARESPQNNEHIVEAGPGSRL